MEIYNIPGTGLASNDRCVEIAFQRLSRIWPKCYQIFRRNMAWEIFSGVIRGDMRAEIRRSRTNSRGSATFPEWVWLQLTYVSRSPSHDFARFGRILLNTYSRFGRNMAWGGCHMGRQGLGCKWVDPSRPQYAFPGLVGPFRAAGGSVRAHFPYFPNVLCFSALFFLFSYYCTVWARPIWTFGHA